jgi:hypothetical protein
LTGLGALLDAKLPFVVIKEGIQHCHIVPLLLGGWLDTFQDYFKRLNIGLMFNPNVFACLRVFHLLLEHSFVAQRH